jgi:hypothetical protein
VVCGFGTVQHELGEPADRALRHFEAEDLVQRLRRLAGLLGERVQLRVDVVEPLPQLRGLEL